MNPTTNTATLEHPRTRTAFRAVTLLVGGYLALSVLTMVVIVLLRHNPRAVNAAAWIRGTIVVLSALVMAAFAVRMARGSAAAHRRLRLLATVMVVAIAVIVAIPGMLPLWMRLEQAACGLLLTAVATLTRGRHLRAVFEEDTA